MRKLCKSDGGSGEKNKEGVKDASVNFMTQKMLVVFDDDAQPGDVMKAVVKNCKKVEDDCEIYL